MTAAAIKAAELAAIDARIAALPVYANQAAAMQTTIAPTVREDNGAPWLGLAADIRRLP